ncbi:MAG: MMPL family transporter [Candidatus Schekmanbacteria bacterium]|nr:MMPL family transporter [Candidatus Schekmanbacteria bacterium]
MSKKAPTLDRWVQFLVHRPIVSMAIGLAVWGVLLTGLPRLTTNFTHTAFFSPNDPLLQRFNAFERRFGNDDLVMVVVHSPSGVFDAETISLVQQLTERLWKAPEVIRVDAVTNFQWVHAAEDEIQVEPLIPTDVPLTPQLLAERKAIALAHEILPDYLISRDGNSAMVYARIKPGLEVPPDAKAITLATRGILAELAGGDHRFYVTGGPVITYAFQESSEKDIARLIPIVLLMTVLFLFLSLRTINGVLLPMTVVVVAVGAGLGSAGWLGIEISTITIVTPQILIAVSIADAVHILSHYYRALRAGVARRDAAFFALRRNIKPTILTSVTTAVGFFSFATAKLEPVSGLGLLAGLGTMAAWLATYWIVGPLMAVLPTRVGWTEGATPPGVSSASMVRYVAVLRKYRVALLSGFTVLSVLAVGVSLRNTVNSDPYKYFAPSYPLRQAQDFLLSKLGGVPGLEMVVDSGVADGVKDPAFMRKLQEFETRALATDSVTRVISLVDTIKQTHRALNGGDNAFYRLPDTKEGIAQELLLYTMNLPQGMDVNDRITIDSDAVRLTLFSRVTDSTRWTRLAAHLESIATELGLDARVTGKTMLYQSMNDYVVSSFVQSIAIAMVLISLILAVALGSLRTGVIAMAPNIVPLLFGGAFLWLYGISLDIGTVLVASVCLGIAVDDTIHILTSFSRHQREGLTPDEALARLFTQTGPALVVTTVVLVGSFGALALGTFVPNVNFGIMTAVVLGAALVADLVFLPALLLVFGFERSTVTPEPVGIASKPELTAAAEEVMRVETLA